MMLVLHALLLTLLNAACVHSPHVAQRAERELRVHVEPGVRASSPLDRSRLARLFHSHSRRLRAAERVDRAQLPRTGRATSQGGDPTDTPAQATPSTSRALVSARRALGGHAHAHRRAHAKGGEAPYFPTAPPSNA